MLPFVLAGLAHSTLMAQPAPAPSTVSLPPEKSWVEFTSFSYEGRDKMFDAAPPNPGEYYNPILSGFYPDPSICRAGDDYYLINSTFSYFPGVPIFHSKDLVSWTQIGNILDRPSQLDVDGQAVSMGIFAPALSYHEGVFYMITTNVRGTGNFYVTATDPAGPWSDPVPLKFEGIDPSFFFDDDGKVYIVHNGNPPDNKPQYQGHRAIWLWEFDPKTRSVANGRIIVNGGVDISKKPIWIEGPHLFKRNGYYYLCCAEGGTSTEHSQVIFRTKSLAEPFVPFEGNPILTQRDLDPNRPNPVTSVGHAQLVETTTGEWWAVFLGVRPYADNFYNTGRETFMLPVTWENDWPIILKKGEPVPRVVKRPNLPAQPAPKIPTTGSFTWRDDFNEKELGLSWNFLRVPKEKWWTLTAKPGSLLIAPRPDALNSVKDKKDLTANKNPSFICRRQQHLDFDASTTLAVNAETAASDAGLAALQNDTNYFFLGVRIKEGKAGEVFLETHTSASQEPEILATAPLPEGVKEVELKIEGAGKDYSFFYRSPAGGDWKALKEKADGSILSTQAAGGFVGTVIGMYARTPRSSGAVAATTTPAREPAAVNTPATLFPLSAVQLLPSVFTDAVAANRKYLMDLDPDRLLAPFLREAGLEMKKPPYPNWESTGLDGHTGGHYLGALADMIASGHDADGELGKRLDYMLSEMERVQNANGDGYIGGVPGSRELWTAVAGGDVGRVWKKWVPWYNIHKTFAGLRDAAVAAGRPKARELLVKLGDWCVNIISKLSDDQMQQMLGNEHGGMSEVMADIYTLTGDKKYLVAAERFTHRAIVDPLMRGEDKLTGLHANTQIPKIIGLEEIATLTGDQKEDFGARFFWDTVVNHRSVAFGGNSVSEHFNDPKDFSTVLEHREGPETCNTYNMLRLTEKLFSTKPQARYADFYERALYNHILSTIDPDDPGYVYFTPIRPEHYRVYSTPQQSFWCCVGTGMENPGRYGQFIYARDKNGGVYVNLFIPSELKVADGFSLRQETKFPFAPSTRLTMQLDKPQSFTLHLRHPWWVPASKLAVRVNGRPARVVSDPTSYADVRREWHNGDTIDVDLPMSVTVEKLPDGSDWAAILDGPIVLAAAEGDKDLTDERAGAGRMSHVASGPMIPLDKVPFLLTTAQELPKHIMPDAKAGPLHFRIMDVVEPKMADGMPIEPFFDIRDQRYQMYWELASADGLEIRRQRLAALEQTKQAREAATLDRVAPGEQQSEVEHDFKTDNSETGIVEGRRWRGRGNFIEYALDAHGAKAAELEVAYWGTDRGSTVDIVADGTVIATASEGGEKYNKFVATRYPIPAEVLAKAEGRRMTIRFVAKNGGVRRMFEVRLMKPGAPEMPEKE